MVKIARQSANNNLHRGNPAWGSKESGTGKSGNPNGPPKKETCLTSLLKEQINTIPPGEKQGRTWRQLLVLAWLTGSMKNPVLLKELLDRVDGKVLQPIGGGDGQAIPVRIIYERFGTSEASRKEG